MHLSLRFKHIAVLSVFLTFVISLALHGSTNLITHAANIDNTVSSKSAKNSAIPTTSCGVWNVVSSPNVGTIYNVLNGVTALSANNVWAVGGYFNNTAPNPQQTLIEHWNGRGWNVVPSPNLGTGSNVLNSVTAVTAKNMWAVGYNLNSGQQTLIEHWDGTSWSVVSSPNVGTNTNVLSAVTKVPGSNQVWAVGYYIDTSTTYQPLIERWNGTSWSVVPNPSLATVDNILNGVTAISATNVWAVGAENNTTAGVEQTLIEHWDGTSWSVISSPNQGGNGYLHSIVPVPFSNKLWSVGQFNNTNTSWETLTEFWNGKSWSVVSSPNMSPEGSTSVNVFLGGTAISKNSAWAVGLYQFSNGTSPTQPLIEHWDGANWSIVSSPNPGAGSALSGITRVPGTSQLWAVGETEPTGGGYQTFIEFYC